MLRLILAGAITAGAATPALAEFIAHRAEYELTLERHSLPGDVASAGGTMQVRYGQTCAGSWTTLMGFDFRLAMTSGGGTRTGYFSRTEESADGRTLRFEHTELADGRVVRMLAGTAHAGTGLQPEALFALPEAQRVALPADTIFPMAAWSDLLARLEAGERTVGYVIFDGWSGEVPDRLRIWATPLADGAATVGAPGAEMPAGPSWHLDSAYFRHGSSDTEPAATAEERLHAGGVSSTIVFDWGLYAVRATLRESEPLPAPECDR